MLRRPIIVTALAAGISIAAMTVATPALAKGPLQARITGPGLQHAVVVSGPGEPGQAGRLAVLAEQTNLFTVLFGPGGSLPAPTMLPAEPPAATLGPRYTVIYTVPGVRPQGNEQFGRIRQDLFPRAAGAISQVGMPEPTGCAAAGCPAPGVRVRCAAGSRGLVGMPSSVRVRSSCGVPRNHPEIGNAGPKPR